MAQASSVLNQFRSANHVASLTHSTELDAKAQVHAQAMAAAGTLFHSSLPAGLSPGWRSLGENIAVAGDVVSAQGWLQASPPHRANMLNGKFNLVGVGVVRSANGSVWVVQDFEQK